jgi:hypothetical protein
MRKQTREEGAVAKSRGRRAKGEKSVEEEATVAAGDQI